MYYSQDNYQKRIDAITSIMLDSGCNDAIKKYTANIYYLNKQYNTGAANQNKWLKANGYTFVISKVNLSYLHNNKRNQLPFIYLYVYTMYFNRAFNLGLQPYELITFDFELMQMYVNPLRKIDKRYNKVKRTI